MSPQRWLAAAAALSLAAVAAALFTQYAWDMQPCPWCVLQRATFVAIAMAAGIGMLFRQTAVRWLSVALVVLLAASGVAAALWQHFVAAASASCNLTLADRIVTALRLDSLLPSVFSATASCAEAAIDLLGLPYEFWSLGVFVAVGLCALLALRR